MRIQPEEIDLAVIPCCTCSQTGRRLGYGGGYYDRYLGRVAGVKAVICRDRIMRDDIPVEEHDQILPLNLELLLNVSVTNIKNGLLQLSKRKAISQKK